MSEMTEILGAIRRGEANSSSDLLPIVYEELRRLAVHQMGKEPAGHTLQATALVHEAWLRLGCGEGVDWNGRNHFFMAAAEAMRRILIERARSKARLKRGGSMERLCLEDVELATTAPPDALLAVEEAQERLVIENPDAAAVVKLRFYVGLSIEEAAEVLGISPATAKRRWACARAWLYSEIEKGH